MTVQSIQFDQVQTGILFYGTAENIGQLFHQGMYEIWLVDGAIEQVVYAHQGGNGIPGLAANSVSGGFFRQPYRHDVAYGAADFVPFPQ